MDASKVIGYDGIFATRLRDLMKNAKATQQDVAAAVGTTRQAISQYADGSVQPNIEKLYKIAEFFKVSADYLLGMSDITTSDVDDKAINQILGLSEKAISLLKEKVDDMLCLYGTSNFNEIIGQHTIPIYQVINLLLEEPDHPGHSVLELLGDVLAHINELDPNVCYGLTKVTIENSFDIKTEPMPHHPEVLTNEDIFAIRVLKLQQAITRYKNELDNKANGGGL